MQYMLLIFNNPANVDEWTEADLEALTRGHAAFRRRLVESGELVNSAGLTHPSNARTVRLRGGVPAVTDGPFVEAKEHLAGYYLVDCESLERAIELAAAVPDAAFHAVELRPVVDPSGMEM